MTKPTSAQYEQIVAKLQAKGIKADAVYNLLEQSKFVVELDGIRLNVYASRVIAMMHEQDEVQPLVL